MLGEIVSLELIFDTSLLTSKSSEIEDCLAAFQRVMIRYPLLPPGYLQVPGPEAEKPVCFLAALELGHRVLHPHATSRFLNQPEFLCPDPLRSLWGEIINASPGKTVSHHSYSTRKDE